MMVGRVFLGEQLNPDTPILSISPKGYRRGAIEGVAEGVTDGTKPGVTPGHEVAHRVLSLRGAGCRWVSSRVSRTVPNPG